MVYYGCFLAWSKYQRIVISLLLSIEIRKGKKVTSKIPLVWFDLYLVMKILTVKDTSIWRERFRLRSDLWNDFKVLHHLCRQRWSNIDLTEKTIAEELLLLLLIFEINNLWVGFILVVGKFHSGTFEKIPSFKSIWIDCNKMRTLSSIYIHAVERRNMQHEYRLNKVSNFILLSVFGNYFWSSTAQVEKTIFSSSQWKMQCSDKV